MMKVKKFRSKKYTDFVKQLPSCISGRPADDPHHIKGHGQGGSVKASDLFVMPLTHDEHTNFHNIGYQSWENIHGSQWVFVLNTIKKALNEGVIDEETVFAEIASQVTIEEDLEFLMTGLGFRGWQKD